GELEDERRSTRLREEAQAFVAEGNYDAALECYDRLFRARPEETSVWFDRAEVLVLLDRSEEALQSYTRILDADRGNARATYERANLLFGLGRLPDAVEALRDALRLEPSKSRYVVPKAEQLRRDGHVNEAIRVVKAVAGEARARAVLGQRGEAEAALAKAIRLGADHLAVRAARDAVARMTRPVAQVSEPAELITDLPSLAKAFEAIEDEVVPPASSVPSDFQSFVESIEPEGEETHVLLQLAELAIEGGDPQMGLLRYEQAIERDPRNADAWTGKGVALQQLERFREALEAYDRALSLKPNHELARKW